MQKAHVDTVNILTFCFWGAPEMPLQKLPNYTSLVYNDNTLKSSAIFKHTTHISMKHERFYGISILFFSTTPFFNW